MCGGGSRSEGQGFANHLGRQELNESHRGSLLNVEITGFLIKDLPPLPQGSA